MEDQIGTFIAQMLAQEEQLEIPVEEQVSPPETDWAEALGLADLETAHGLPEGLLAAVLQKESSGNPMAESSAGAQGLFQFMPATAEAFGIDPLVPEEAASGAAQYYAKLLKQFGGDLKKALAAYNWGPGNVKRKGLEKAPKETQNYVKDIVLALAGGK